MIWLLVVVIALILVVVAALLSAGESAITVFARSDLQELADENPGNPGLREIANDPERHENAATFARSAIETIATVLVTVWLTTVFEQVWPAFLIAAAVMMFVHFLLGGSIARSVGRTLPAATLRITAWLLRGVRVTTGLVADLLVAIGDSVTPMPGSRSGSLSSEEQLLSMVDEATEDEVLDEDDRELIHSIFDFSDRVVREVMVARTDMITVDAESSARDALTELLNAGISRAPIIGRDGDDVRGIAFQKDLAKLLVEPGAAANYPVLGVARPATFVPESLGANDLLRRMQRESTHFAIVIDEYGGVAGLVTIEDLIEELVGEISDEHDRQVEDVELLADGGMRVSSRMSTSDLEELFDIEIDEEDVDSVGGLLAKGLGKIPVLGDQATVNGLQLTADRVGRRHRVTEVTVRVVGQGSRSSGFEPLRDSLTGVLDDRDTNYPHDTASGRIPPRDSTQRGTL